MTAQTDAHAKTRAPRPTLLRGPDGHGRGVVGVLVDVTKGVPGQKPVPAASTDPALSNAVQDEFLGLISHELRTPVTSIYGNAILLASRLGPEAAGGAMARDIADDADRLLRIVENLLQLARLGSGSILHREPFVLDHIVHAAIGSRLRRHPDRPIRLTFSQPSLVVLADAIALGMVIENLLSNADKYGRPGDPTEVVVTSDGERADVRILDRGIGIPQDLADDVFTAFFRADQARRTAGGVGVGLAVCKRIVEAHGGQIWAVSRDGGGAEVGFSLSLDPETDDLGD